MAKEFFVRFGYTQDNMDVLAELIKAESGISFTEKKDPILGRELMYEGPLADKILISDNYYEDDDYWMCENFKDCPIIVNCAFRSGKKDMDNEIKAVFLKGILEKIPDLKLIDFEGRDPKEFDPEEAFKKQGIEVGDQVVLPNKVKH